MFILNSSDSAETLMSECVGLEVLLMLENSGGAKLIKIVMIKTAGCIRESDKTQIWSARKTQKEECRGNHYRFFPSFSPWQVKKFIAEEIKIVGFLEIFYEAKIAIVHM